MPLYEDKEVETFTTAYVSDFELKIEQIFLENHRKIKSLQVAFTIDGPHTGAEKFSSFTEKNMGERKVTPVQFWDFSVFLPKNKC